MSNYRLNFNYQVKNASILKLIEDYEAQFSELFSKVKKDWLPGIRDFLREETGLKLHQRIVGQKIEKDSNLTFSFVPDYDNQFLKLVDENYPDLDFEEFASFRKLFRETQASSRYFNSNNRNPSEDFNRLNKFLEEYCPNTLITGQKFDIG